MAALKLSQAAINLYARELRRALLVGLLIFIALELLAPGSARSVLNLDWWLVGYLISVIMVWLTN